MIEWKANPVFTDLGVDDMGCKPQKQHEAEMEQVDTTASLLPPGFQRHKYNNKHERNYKR